MPAVDGIEAPIMIHYTQFEVIMCTPQPKWVSLCERLWYRPVQLSDVSREETSGGEQRCRKGVRKQSGRQRDIMKSFGERKRTREFKAVVLLSILTLAGLLSCWSIWDKSWAQANLIRSHPLKAKQKTIELEHTHDSGEQISSCCRMYLKTVVFLISGRI